MVLVLNYLSVWVLEYSLLLVKKIIYIQDARSILIITVHKIILVNFFDFQWTRVNWKLEVTKKQMCKKLSLVTVHPRWFPMKASTDRHLIREVRHRCARWRGRWPCCWSSRVSVLSWAWRAVTSLESPRTGWAMRNGSWPGCLLMRSTGSVFWDDENSDENEISTDRINFDCWKLYLALRNVKVKN